MHELQDSKSLLLLAVMCEEKKRRHFSERIDGLCRYLCCSPLAELNLICTRSPSLTWMEISRSVQLYHKQMGQRKPGPPQGLLMMAYIYCTKIINAAISLFNNSKKRGTTLLSSTQTRLHSEKEMETSVRQGRRMWKHPSSLMIEMQSSVKKGD